MENQFTQRRKEDIIEFISVYLMKWTIIHCEIIYTRKCLDKSSLALQGQIDWRNSYLEERDWLCDDQSSEKMKQGYI